MFIIFIVLSLSKVFRRA